MGVGETTFIHAIHEDKLSISSATKAPLAIHSGCRWQATLSDITCLLFVGNAFAQSMGLLDTDSLRHELLIAKDDTSRV